MNWLQKVKYVGKTGLQQLWIPCNLKTEKICEKVYSCTFLLVWFIYFLSFIDELHSGSYINCFDTPIYFKYFLKFTTIWRYGNRVSFSISISLPLPKKKKGKLIFVYFKQLERYLFPVYRLCISSTWEVIWRFINESGWTKRLEYVWT